MRLERILVGLDGSEGSARALDWAVGLAKRVGAEIVALHVLNPVPGPFWSFQTIIVGAGMAPRAFDRWREQVSERLEREWCAPLRTAGVHYRTLISAGNAASALIEVARSERADLIAIGHCGHSGFAELILGSVSHQLSHHARCPVVIVPLTVAEPPSGKRGSLCRAPASRDDSCAT